MISLVPLRPQVLTGRPEADAQRLGTAFTVAWETGVLTPERLCTGSIHAAVAAASYRVVVMRYFPPDRRRNMDHEWRPDLAPSPMLLGRYQRRELSWRAFATQYLAQFDRAPTATLIRLVEWLGDIPARYPTVTFLCCEPAPGGDEAHVRCHRRLLRAWLSGQAVPDVER